MADIIRHSKTFCDVGSDILAIWWIKPNDFATS